MTTLEQARIGEKDKRKSNRYGWKCLVDKLKPTVEVIEEAPVKIVPKKGKK